MPRQTGFNGGELAPELWGRTDFPKYASGLRRCRNFIPTVQGAAMSRPGTTFVAEVKDATAGAVRLIPFVYSETQAFVLEFGDLYVRFCSNGAQVVDGGGSPVEVVTPYTIGEVGRIKYAQQGAVLTLCHPSHPPAELSWDGTTWTYAVIDFSRPACTGEPLLRTASKLITPDTTHVGKEWAWQVTEVRRDADKGFIYESKPVTNTDLGIVYYEPWDATLVYKTNTIVKDPASSTYYKSLQNNNVNHVLTDASWWAVDASSHTNPPPVQGDTMPTLLAVYTDSPATLEMRTPYTNISTDPNFIAYRVYRGRGGVFGWVGDTTKTTFTDTGDAPDFTQTPPQGTNPFAVYAADGSLTRTEYPSCAAFFEGRRIFANTSQRPAYLFGSATGDYANFDRRLVPTASDEVEFELATKKWEEIRSLLGADKMLAFTSSSVWAISGSNGPLTFDSVDAHAQPGQMGASWLEPLETDGGALYVQAMNSGVRAAAFDFTRNAFVGSDLSVLAQHLFRGHTVVEWCFAPVPWSVVWAVRNDGLLLSLTYDARQQVFAWAWHDTQGAFESVCAIPEGTEHAVYVQVKRTVHDVDHADNRDARYIERLGSRVVPASASVDDMVTLDCARYATNVSSVTFDSPYSPASPDTILWPTGTVGYVIADGNVYGPIDAAANGGVYNLPATAAKVRWGLSFTPELETVDQSSGEARSRQKTATALAFDVFQSRGLSFGQDFDHLEEWTQRTVADGYAAPPLTTTTVRVPLSGKWSRDARVCLRQTSPLPVTVVGLTPELDNGG